MRRLGSESDHALCAECSTAVLFEWAEFVGHVGSEEGAAVLFNEMFPDGDADDRRHRRQCVRRLCESRDRDERHRIAALVGVDMRPSSG